MTDPSSGLFISFEGSEGSGKSTQIHRLAERLQQHRREVLLTREPGGTPIGEEIRHLLIHSEKGGAMNHETEMLLFAASRAQLVREIIRPSLTAGKVIICDRYLDSSRVYQGAARGLPFAAVESVNALAVDGTHPDLTVLLDVPVDVSLARVHRRSNGSPDRIEQEDRAFFQRVRDGYLELARREPDRFLVLDGTQSADSLADEIWRNVEARIA